MLQLAEFQTILADSFFDGNTTIAGIIMYIAVLGIVFGLFRSLKTVLTISMRGCPCDPLLPWDPRH